ncbi:MAG: TVP38/TMEM64 family protein [Nevskia sp.]|nr:TVP38/TMEM64 family protein [Nevskia sp.]
MKHAWLLVGLYVLRLPLFLPASLVIVLTGMICGPVWGELVAVAGLTLGGGIEFFLVRTSAASLIGRWSDAAVLRHWRQRINHNPFHSVLLMRLCFVPFDAVNIASALALAPLRPFLLATVLGVIPTSLPMVLSGASIDFDAWMASGRIWPGLSAIHWPYIAASVFLSVLIAWHARMRRRMQEQAPA